jgi:hypothetical protein
MSNQNKLLVIVGALMTLLMLPTCNLESEKSGPSSMVELGTSDSSSLSSVSPRSMRSVIGSVSSLELHIRGLYLVVKNGPHIPFIHDEEFSTTHGGPTLHNAKTDPVGWYSFYEMSQIKWRGGTNHLQWYTEGLSYVLIMIDNIKINGAEYPGISKFSFSTPTDIPNIYAEDLTVMNFYVTIPETLSLSSSPDEDAFMTELKESVVVTAEIR